MMKKQGSFNKETLLKPFDWATMSFGERLLLVTVLSATVIMLAWSMFQFEIAPALTPVKEEFGFPIAAKIMLSNGILTPQEVTIKPGECVAFDARGQERFGAWDFGDEGQVSSQLTGRCTISWLEQPGNEMKISAIMDNGQTSAATIKFQ